MARFTYSTDTPFGQLISGAIDKLNTSTLDIDRSASAIAEMTPEQGVAELGIKAEDLQAFKNRLSDIKDTLEAEQFQKLLVMFDQG